MMTDKELLSNARYDAMNDLSYAIRKQREIGLDVDLLLALDCAIDYDDIVAKLTTYWDDSIRERQSILNALKPSDELVNG